MTWHADTELIAGYIDGRLSPAHAASLEAHLMECDACRAMVSQSMDPARIRRSWQAVETMIDQPHRSMIERLLVRLGVRDHDARIGQLTQGGQRLTCPAGTHRPIGQHRDRRPRCDRAVEQRHDDAGEKDEASDADQGCVDQSCAYWCTKQDRRKVSVPSR